MAEASSIPSVWARDRREQDQPALSRATIVRAAVEVLDAEGIEALSMRKLGARLGAGATSLYRHVATKDELMELAVDEIFGEMAVPRLQATREWRASVSAAAADFRATALRHPWLASVLGQAGLAYLGPRLMAYTDGLAGLFTDAGFEKPRGAIDVVLGYVLGMSTTEAAWLAMIAKAGTTEAEFVAKLLPAASQAMAGHEHLARTTPASDADAVANPAAAREARFAQGLEVVLDGLALRLKS